MNKLQFILSALLIVLLAGSAFAQGVPCPYTEGQLKKLGSWLCPDYRGYYPGPGFPGNPIPITLPEAVVTPDSGGNTIGPPPPTGFPPPMPLPGGGYGGNHLKNPCPGDPVMSPSIAPTAAGYKGGTYGYTRKDEGGRSKFHDGIDIKTPVGTAIFSMYDGVVIKMESSLSPTYYNKISYGNYVTIKSTINGQIVTLRYAHLNSVSGDISIGAKVKQGTQLGLSGITGNAAGKNVIPHLHIQAKDKNGKSINPEPFLGTKFDHKTGKGTKPCK